jgi:hypothetical protein
MIRQALVVLGIGAVVTSYSSTASRSVNRLAYFRRWFSNVVWCLPAYS